MLVASLVLSFLGTMFPAGLRLEAMLGAAWNAPVPLAIRQAGEPELRIHPRWSTRFFEFPLYYAVRIEGESWGATLVHHKLDLRNPPEEVEAFAISHGYNFLLASHRWSGPWRLRVGAGPVIAHPENSVRGRKGPEGYRLAGGVIEGGAGREFGRGRVRWVSDLAASAAWARVPVAGGHADVPNLAIHLRLGASLVAERR